METQSLSLAPRRLVNLVYPPLVTNGSNYLRWTVSMKSYFTMKGWSAFLEKDFVPQPVNEKDSDTDAETKTKIIEKSCEAYVVSQRISLLRRIPFFHILFHLYICFI